jgi:hypothetical protein
VGVQTLPDNIRPVKFTAATTRHRDYPYHLLSSEDGLWHIAIKPVIFGSRVIAWRQDSAGPCVDYCAGDNPAFLFELLDAVTRIFQRMPDGISERQVTALMPRYERRPIDQDPCWPALQALATDPTPFPDSQPHE